MKKLITGERGGRSDFRPGFFLTAFCLLSALFFYSIPLLAANEVNSFDISVHKNIFEMSRWSPYLAGIGIGILSWIAFVLSDHPIGVSGAYAQTAGMLEKSFSGDDVEEKLYYREHVPRISWTWIMVAGLFLGAFVSSLLSGDFRLEWVPALWETKFGYSPVIRVATAFTGGIMLGIGSRWADGCTSGHGISGTLQLIIRSWIAVICFFISGIIVAHLIY